CTEGCEPAAENIERVLNFLPIFEDTERGFFEPAPGSAHGGYRFSPEVHRFTQVAVEQGLICESRAVEWLGKKAALYREPGVIDSADLYACQRLLTAIVDDNPQVAIKLPEALS